VRSAFLAALLVLTAAARASASEIISVAAPIAPEKVYTLDDAERLALLNDARLLSAEQDKTIADERVRQARYLFFPEVGLQGSATKYEARYPFSLSNDYRNILLFPDQPNLWGQNTGTIYSGRGYFHMNIFEGGRTLGTLRLAEAGQKQATSAHESAKMDLLLSVKEAFYRLILAQERLTSSGDYQRAVEDAVANGHLDALERVEAEARQAEARAKTSEAQHGVDLARLSFLKILNVELDTPFRVEGVLEAKPVDVDIDRAVLWAIELRPELQSETYKAQMDAISVNLAAARRIPTIFLDSDYELTGVDFPLRNNNWDATVGIRIPFSYDYWSQLRQRKAEQRQGQLKRAELQDRVRLEVRQAYENLLYWQREWPLREAQLTRVQKLYADAGKGGAVLSRVRAMGSVLDLKLDYLSAVTEHIIALARLERAVGRELRP